MQLGIQSCFPPVLLFTEFSQLCRKPSQNWEGMTQNEFQLLLPHRRAIHFNSTWTLIPFLPATLPRRSFQVRSLCPSHHAAAIVLLLFCTPPSCPPPPHLLPCKCHNMAPKCTGTMSPLGHVVSRVGFSSAAFRLLLNAAALSEPLGGLIVDQNVRTQQKKKKSRTAQHNTCLLCPERLRQRGDRRLRMHVDMCNFLSSVIKISCNSEPQQRRLKTTLE